MTPMPSRQEMERAYHQRDEAYDSVFVLAVRTTGIFCRPSCGARKPRPENVEYYPTPREALTAGYRPCKRCKPMIASTPAPEWLPALLALVERDPMARHADAKLRAAGFDPVTARRYFQRTYGMTFQAYCRARRLGRALEQIRRGENLDDVALGFGYESHSGFRSAFSRTFGGPPGKKREQECIVVSWIESPLGPLLAGATREGLCLLEFTDRRMLDAQFKSLRRHFRMPIVPGENEHTQKTRAELEEYFAGKRTTFSVPLIAPGSDFQRRVWEELRKIPYGTTISYEEMARRVGSRAACRAVGTANGMNRIGIVIPCHRVVNKNGQLGGYGGGLWRKRKLLDLEQAGVAA